MYLTSLRVLLFATIACGAGPLFGACPEYTASSISIGITPRAITAADFNRDGLLDIASANYGTATVSVALATAPGTLGSPVGYATGTSPIEILAADFNRDGHVDLAALNAGPGTVSILLGTATGSFGTPTHFTVGPVVTGMTAADFDLNGTLDLAVTRAGGVVAILAGSGTGSFGAAVTYAASLDPQGVIAADFNRDGKMDLAVANAGSNDVTVLMGNGAGAFAGAVHYPVGLEPRALAADDFNRDGHPHLVVANYASDNVSILINNGSGLFLDAVSHAVGDGPISVATGDGNGDGRPDLFVTNAVGGTLSFLPGHDSGQFGAAMNTAAANPAKVIVGDFNRDGRLDAALTDTVAHTAKILRNSGDCSRICANYSVTKFPILDQPLGLTAADVNNDGKPDLVVFNPAPLPALSRKGRLAPALHGGGPGSGNNTQVLLGDGTGKFAHHTSLPTGAPTGAAIGDYNHDGILDGAFAMDSGAYFGLGTGNGFFGAVGSVLGGTNGGAVDIAAGDFNGDGHLDFAAPKRLGNVEVRLGTGTGTFGTVSTYTTIPANRIIVADVVVDGKLDLILSHKDANTITVLSGAGDGSFAHYASFDAPASPDSIAVDDLNGDGLLDVVVACLNTVAIFYGHPTTLLAEPILHTVPQVTSVATGDLHGDGVRDVLAGSGVAVITIMMRADDGSYTVGSLPFGEAITAIVVADFNGDGRDDAAVTMGDERAIAFFNLCPLPSTVALTSSQNPSVIGTEVTFTATVVSDSGSSGLTGMVEFARRAGFDSSVVATVPLSGSVATYSTSSLEAGPNDYEANYLGNPSHGRSSGSIIQHAVNAAGPPTAVDAHSGWSGNAFVTWVGVFGATEYEVVRSSSTAATPMVIGTSTDMSFYDTTAPPNTTQVYRIRASAPFTSGFSGPDRTTFVTFTDSFLNGMLIKAVHLLELRTAVNAYRASAALAAAEFTDPVPVTIKAAHIQELRTALDEARTAISLPPATYDEVVTPGVPVRSGHFSQLRNLVD